MRGYLPYMGRYPTRSFWLHTSSHDGHRGRHEPLAELEHRNLGSQALIGSTHCVRKQTVPEAFVFLSQKESKNCIWTCHKPPSSGDAIWTASKQARRKGGQQEEVVASVSLRLDTAASYATTVRQEGSRGSGAESQTQWFRLGA